MAATTGYRIISRDALAAPVTGTAPFWAEMEGGSPVLAEPGSTVTDDFWVSPNARAPCSWVWARPLWSVAIVEYDTGDIIDTVDDGKPDITFGDPQSPLNPELTKVRYKVAEGDVVDEFSHEEIKRISIWADYTAAGELSAADILAAHGVSEIGPPA